MAPSLFSPRRPRLGVIVGTRKEDGARRVKPGRDKLILGGREAG